MPRSSCSSVRMRWMKKSSKKVTGDSLSEWAAAKSAAFFSINCCKLIGKSASQVILITAFAARRNAKGSDEPVGNIPKPQILTNVSKRSANPTTRPVKVCGKLSLAPLGK